MRAMVIVAAVALTSCSAGFFPKRPSVEVIDQLERRLAEQACVGSLARWERHYAYAVKPLVTGRYGWDYHWYDYGRIFIDLRQAGFDEFRGGRHIHDKRLPYRGWADDRSYDLASGVYDIGADRITFSHCGPNV